jgi:hypothetical protein
VKITSLAAAEAGWKALFSTPEGEESQSRVVSWGLGDDGALLGLIVHPDDRRAIVPAPDATLADGSTFSGYGFRPS